MGSSQNNLFFSWPIPYTRSLVKKFCDQIVVSIDFAGDACFRTIRKAIKPTKQPR